MNVDFVHKIYQQSLFENDRNINFWEKYIADLNALDFKVYSDKLTVPTLVPIGGRILFRGELKHTNEVTVALGADYFVKCSLTQAEVLRDHRLKDAKSKLDLLKKEKDYLEKQISFAKQSFTEGNTHDILEVCSEEEDKAWRQQHRENMRKYKQQKDKVEEEQTNEMTEDEIWNRLEELELQEELQNELSTIKCEQIVEEDDNENNNESENKNENKNKSKNDSKNENYKKNGTENNNKESEETYNRHPDTDDDSDVDVNDYAFSREELVQRMKLVNESYTHFMHRPNIRNESKLELMHEIIERHKLILKTLSQFKKEGWTPCTSENDLLQKLDEIERVEELEDQMDRLEDMINNCESEYEDEEEVQESDSKLKKSVSFADEDSSETVQLTFKHSDIEPSNKPYDPEKGILKPSDIYEAYATKVPETSSILKKTNHVAPKIEEHVEISQSTHNGDQAVMDPNTNNIIVIKDVVEKTDSKDKSMNKNERPMSLFKKKRQQQKT